MNCVAIMGGLGNQFFQYTFYKFLCEKNGKPTVITKYWYDSIMQMEHGGTSREYSLDKYNINYSEIQGIIPCRNRLTEFRNEYINNDDVFYEGYWDDLRFVEPVLEQVRSDLTLREELIDSEMLRIADMMKNETSVSVHIRRTDYLNSINSNIFEQLSIQYYKEALRYLKKSLNDELVLYVFSDDELYIESNMKNFEGFRTIIMKKREPHEDNWLMQKTKHHIIANSTFSLWASYLANKDGITIAPKNWFKDRRSHNIYPDGWVII